MNFSILQSARLARRYQYLICLAMTWVLGISASIAEDSAPPYQSTFDDYKSTNDDHHTDWKSLDASIADQGHQMPGMQHASDQPMNHEAMGHRMPHGDTHASDDAKSAMPLMDHSTMQGMDQHRMSALDHRNMYNKYRQTEAMEHRMVSMDHASTASSSSAHTHDHAMMKHAEMAHGNMHDIHHSAADTADAASMSHEPQAVVSDPEDPHASHMPTSSKRGKPQPQTPSTHTGFQIIPNLHPAVVHFPIALTMVAFIFGLSARLLRRSPSSTLLAAAGNYTLILAAVSAVAAVGFGWLAFNATINHDDAGHTAMLLHRAWAVPTAAGIVLLALWNSSRSDQGRPMSIPVLVCLAGLSMAVATTAWLGGEVVYRHGIGVLSLPASGAHHHAGHPQDGAIESAIPVQDSDSGRQHAPVEGDAHEH